MPYQEVINVEGVNDPNDLQQLIEKREPIVQQLMDDFKECFFKKKNIRIESIDHAAILLTGIYYNLVYNNFKPFIEDKINKFKMASVMELVIVQQQVLFYQEFDARSNRELNADFALVAAFSLLDCMIYHATQEIFCNTLNNPFNKVIDDIIDGHRFWLSIKKPDEMPVLLNSQFYELIHAFQTLPVQQNGN